MIPIEPLIIELLEILDDARMVGGYVRNVIRRLDQLRPMKTDLDIATILKPYEVMERLSSRRIKVIPTGIDHGTVTAIYDGKQIEITTLRTDIACYGRHAEVRFGSSWQEDAARRDFTMNALYLDGRGKIYDYFGGIDDLYHGKVKFIGNPEQRILEDHLRILRYFRFSAMFVPVNAIESMANEFDDHKSIGNLKQENLDREKQENLAQNSNPGFNAAVSMAGLLQHISKERIRGEMMKLLVQVGTGFILMQMLKTRVLDKIYLPLRNIKNNQLITMRFSTINPIVNLGSVLKLDEWHRDEVIALGKNWRLSRNEVNNLIFLVECDVEHNVENPLSHSSYCKRILYHHGIERYQLYKEMMRIIGKDTLKKDAVVDATESKAEQSDFNEQIDSSTLSIPKFPLKSQEVMKLGYQGKKLGEVLHRAEEHWLDSGCMAKENDLMKLVKNFNIS